METYSITQSVVGTGYYYNQNIQTGNSGQQSETGAPSSPEYSGTDQVTLSPEGQEKSASGNGPETSPAQGAKGDAGLQLSQEQIAELQKLKQRDTEVRIHEQAHLSVAGSYARGGASFTLQRGPDGASYAIGGEVGIDVGKESTPEATIAKMQTVKRAALAPADPSGADRRIASQASVMEAQARQELIFKTQEELLKGASPGTPDAQGSDKSSATEPGKPAEASYGTLQRGIAAYKKVADS